MENKYQEALDTLHLLDEHYRKAVPIFEEKYKETPYLVIQELVDKTKKPKPTEQQILKKFEELGYECIINDKYFLELRAKRICNLIHISKKYKWYGTAGEDILQIGIQEHQLLHELFTVWGWFDE